ncbi:MAG: DMT family transporter [Gammaproteobacteria bacterium]
MVARQSTVTSHATILPLAILLILGLTWGGTTNIAKFVAMHGVSPLSYGCWMTGGAGLLLLIVNAARGYGLPLSGRLLRYYFLCGITANAIPTTLMMFVLTEIPAGIMVIVIATAPLFTYLFALLAALERFAWRRAAGIGLGFVGVLFMLLPAASLPDRSMAPFVLLALLTPAFYALSSVYATRHRPADVDSRVLACGLLLGAGTFLLIVVLLLDPPLYPLWAELSVVNGFIYLHIAAAALAFSLFYVLLRLEGPVFFSQVAYLVTLFGICFGMVFFGERHSAWIWAALLLIFAGLALVNSQREQARSD